MHVQRTRTQHLRAPLTRTLGHPKSTQCNFNSFSFNYKSDYHLQLTTTKNTNNKKASSSSLDKPWSLVLSHQLLLYNAIAKLLSLCTVN